MDSKEEEKETMNLAVKEITDDGFIERFETEDFQWWKHEEVDEDRIYYDPEKLDLPDGFVTVGTVFRYDDKLPTISEEISTEWTQFTKLEKLGCVAGLLFVLFLLSFIGFAIYETTVKLLQNNG